MKEFIDWLVQNWQFVSSAAISVVSFILLLLFKRNKIFIEDRALMSKIVDFVLQAEQRFGAGHGKEKLDFVLRSIFPESEKIDDLLRASIVPLVEKVLSTPQKKEK